MPCEVERGTPDIAVISIDSISSLGSVVKMRVNNKDKEVKISLPAVYKVYNAAAVCAAEEKPSGLFLFFRKTVSTDRTLKNTTSKDSVSSSMSSIAF